MVFAEGAYEDLLIRHKGGFSLRELTVDKFFYDWLERKSITSRRLGQNGKKRL